MSTSPRSTRSSFISLLRRSKYQMSDGSEVDYKAMDDTKSKSTHLHDDNNKLLPDPEYLNKILTMMLYVPENQKNQFTALYKENRISSSDLKHIIDLHNQYVASFNETINYILNKSSMIRNRIRLYTDQDYNYKTSNPDPALMTTMGMGVYFHGVAQEILGHDIVCVPINTVLNEGIYNFEVVDRTHGHQIITGVLYLWDSPRGQKGLAIIDGVSDEHIYARKCFDSKSSFL